MLRRFAPWRMFLTSGGGSALHVATQAAPTPDRATDHVDPAEVLLPWTARPWAVTHSVHHAQWKFLDTVFAHLATVTPAELSERAREQGARDVLCDLEEPVLALRRQQARQARQQRRQEKADAAAAAAEARPQQDTRPADLAVASASSSPVAGSNSAALTAAETKGEGEDKKDAPVSMEGAADPLSSLLSSSLSPSKAHRGEKDAQVARLPPPQVLPSLSTTTAAAVEGSNAISERDGEERWKASQRNVLTTADASAATSCAEASTTVEMNTSSVPESAAAAASTDSTKGAEGPSTETALSTPTAAVVEVAAATNSTKKSSGKKTKTKKSKRNKKVVDVIHYL